MWPLYSLLTEITYKLRLELAIALRHTANKIDSMPHCWIGLVHGETGTTRPARRYYEWASRNHPR